MKHLTAFMTAFLIFSVSVSFAGAIANPAPIYCTEMGYTVDGEYCVFPDNERCEQWAFYRGECGERYAKDLACIESGGPLKPGHECCAGLVPISKDEAGPDGSCAHIIGAYSICAPCGNDVCDRVENICSCPEDCKAETTSGTSGGSGGTTSNLAQDNATGAVGPGSVAVATIESAISSLGEEGVTVRRLCREGEITIIRAEENDKNIVVDLDSNILVTKKCINICKEANVRTHEVEGEEKVLSGECRRFCEEETVDIKPWIRKLECKEEDFARVVSAIIPVSRPQRVCVPSDELMIRLKETIRELDEASERGDDEKVRRLKELVSRIKREIEEETHECSASSTVTGGIAEPAQISRGDIETRRVISIDVCAQLESWLKKRDHYATIISNAAKMLELGLTEEETERIIEELEQGIEGLEIKCKKVAAGETVEVEAIKPVAVESGEEISTYYKTKVQKLMGSAENIDQKIDALKEIRGEIDSLIAELIEKKSEFRLEEMKGLVDEIKIRPNKIKAGSVEVQTTKKKIKFKFKNRALNVHSREGKVVLEDGEVVADADELSVSSEGNISIHEKEIKTLPSEVIVKLKVTPKKIEIKIEKDKPVYLVSAEEKKNLLGFIPVNIEKEIVVDASTEDAEIIEEKTPWWYFLAI